MAPPNRRMCSELVRELCLEIPTAKTSDRILLTAHKMYIYLAPGFSKKLIYRDAIAFLEAKFNAREKCGIRIYRHNENEPIVIRQKQWVDKGKTNFELETNKFRIQIRTRYNDQNKICIVDNDGQFLCAHFLYFLRLIAPLIGPIQLRLEYYSSRIPIAALGRFMNTQSDWIDSIRLWDDQFDSEPIYGALRKYNKLQIYESISPANVPKMIHWLTSNNNDNGQPKKCLDLRQGRLDVGLAVLIDELKKEFAGATSTSRFVVRLELRERLSEFTMRNELTGERLELRRKNYKDGRYIIHALCRSPNNGLDENANDCTELERTEMHLFY